MVSRYFDMLLSPLLPLAFSDGRPIKGLLPAARSLPALVECFEKGLMVS